VENSSCVLFGSTNLSGDCGGQVTPHKGSSTRSAIYASRHQFVSSTSHSKKIAQVLVILLR
jgi:hypothetical protein